MLLTGHGLVLHPVEKIRPLEYGAIRSLLKIDVDGKKELYAMDSTAIEISPPQFWELY